jgi:hypothetical protein
MDPFTIAAFSIAGGAEIGKMFFESNAAKEQKKALELESKESELQYQQKLLANYDTMQKVLDAQLAQASARGVSLASPSFNAIQRQTFNVGAKQARNLQLEESISQANIEAEKYNVKQSLHAQLFGDVATLASEGYNFYENAPRKA